jgi:predicted chitinase
VGNDQMVEPSPNEITSLNFSLQRLSKVFQGQFDDFLRDVADAMWQAAA